LKPVFLSNKPLLQVILLGLIAIIYFQVGSFDYNLDDELVLADQTHNNFSWNAFSDLWTQPYDAAFDQIQYEYRPVSSTSFYIEGLLLGSSSAISHIINLVLYGLLVLLVFNICTTSRLEVWVAFFVAALFAVHPLHTEVVASIKNRDELLAMIFGATAIYVLLRNYRFSIAISIIAIIISLLSKKTGFGVFMVLPFIYLHFSNRRFNFWILAATCSLLSFIFIPQSDLVKSMLVAFGYLLSCLFFDRFHTIHGQRITWKLGYEVLLAVAVFLTLFSISSFNVFVAIASISFVLLAQIHLKNRVSFFILLFVILSIAIISFNWQILILLIFFIEKYNFSEGKIKVIGYSLILLSLLAIGILKPSFAIKIGLFLLYLVPFVFERLQKKPFSYIYLALFAGNFIIAIVNFNPRPEHLIVLFFTITIISKLANHKINWRFEPLLIVVLTTFIFLFIGINKLDLNLANLKNPQVLSLTQDAGRQLDIIESPINENTSIPNRILAAVNTYGFYISKSIAPISQSFYYGYNTVDLFSISAALFWLFIIFLPIYFLVRFTGYASIPTLCYVVFLIALFPFSNLVMPVAGIVGDRLAFFPSLFFIGAVVTSVSYFPATKPIQIVFGAIILVFLGLSFSRTGYWQSKEKLYLNDILVQPNSAKINELIGEFYLQKGDETGNIELFYPKAYQYYKKGSEIAPNYYYNWYIIGYVTQMLGRVEQALDAYIKVQDSPYVDQVIHLNIAICATQTGEFDIADRSYQRAINVASTKLQAYKNYVFLLFKTNNVERAKAVSLSAIQEFPTDASLYENHARLLYGEGDISGTISYLQMAINLGADNESNTTFLNELLSKEL
jgi:hypothetical protein